MKNRMQRQLAIREILRSRTIDSQEKLLVILHEQGFGLTQATLSRDMKTLKVAKVPEGKQGYRYIIPEAGTRGRQRNNRQASFLADGFRGIEFSGNLAVIRTLPGYASSIAAVLDDADPYEILGTIAGDDTILIVMREGVTPSDLSRTLTLVMPRLGGKMDKLS